jgi:preprotein translocase subunit SecD
VVDPSVPLGGERDRWFVLGGTPALTDMEIESATAILEPSDQPPSVAIELTPRGQAAFSTLTRELARRGSTLATAGSGVEATWQHLAIAIDDQIVAVPFIDWRQAPDGIDGAGALIQGDLTPQTARRFAAIVDTGPLPSALLPEQR